MGMSLSIARLELQVGPADSRRLLRDDSRRTGHGGLGFKFSNSKIACPTTPATRWPIWDLVKFSANFQLLQTSPKLEEVTHCDVGNAMRDSHFFLTRVSGVGTLARADDGQRRSSDGSVLGSGDIPRYTKRSYLRQLGGLLAECDLGT